MTRGEALFASSITINNFHNALLEGRVCKLEEDFRDKFNSVSTLVTGFESSLKRQLDELPKELIQQFKIVEEYQLVQKYKEELGSIDEDIQACEQASNWLDINRKELIGYAVRLIFSNEYKLKRFNGVQVSREAVQLFWLDLDSYFRWLSHHLHIGTIPKEIPNGVIALALPPQIYIEAFEVIRNDKVSVSAGLSERSVTMLTSYINRFLIKRKLELDAPRQ